MAVLNPLTLPSRPWLALLAIACTVDRGEGGFAPQDTEDIPDASVSVLERRDANAGPTGDSASRPTGVWLFYLEQHHCLTALNQVIENVVSTWYRIDVELADRGPEPDQTYLRHRAQMCAQTISPVIAGLVTHVPDAIPAHLPPMTFEGHLLDDGRYVSSEAIELWGLDEAETEGELPDRPDDPRYIDQDADGEPGVTLVIGNNFCEVYVAQRTQMRLGGSRVAPNRIEGTAKTEVDKVVLGASAELCGAPNTISEGGRPSRFVFVRIDGEHGGLDLDFDADGEITCAEIEAATSVFDRDGIIEPQVPDDAVCR